MLGLDAKYKDISTLREIKHNLLDTYLILDHKIMEKPKGHFFRNVLSYFDGKILVLGNNKMSPAFHSHIILPSDTEQEILSKLELFFSDAMEDKKMEGNDVLSPREIDILKEVALGYSNKEIGDRLFISINTVITHRKNITDKLGIKTISGLTVYALMNNLIDANDVTL